MHERLRDIPGRILGLAEAALTQANTHAVYIDPGNEHWPLMSVINTAHAGELFLKAIIAAEHPLLIFRDLFSLDDGSSEELDIDQLLARGRTHDFERLPQVLWATTGRRIPNPECYKRLRRARNAIQHFCAPQGEDLSALSREFIYTIIDPLIFEVFGLYAIEYHEDHGVSYDYVVGALLRDQLCFSVPLDFHLTEIDPHRELADALPAYRDWFTGATRQVRC